MKNKLKKIKATIYESLLETTIQGIPNLIRTKYISLKIIWLILLLISTSCCIYYIIDSYSAYLDYETVTTIKKFSKDSMIFPVVSICNEYKKLSTSFLNFSFNANNLKSWKKHMEVYNDATYGICYRFNSGFNFTNQTNPFKYSTLGGPIYGLKMDLYAPSDYDFNRLKIFIHDQTVKPLSLYNKGYYVTSGTFNYFGIQIVSNIKLEEPYNPCLVDFKSFSKNRTLINYFIENNTTYSHDECIYLCTNLKYRDVSENICNCSLNIYDCVYVPEDESVRKCAYDFLKKFQADKPSVQCADYCPFDCVLSDYVISHYLEPILAKGKINDNSFKYLDFKTYENVTKSFFSINIYFENLDYTLISQKPKLEMFDLISNIGGLFGLFLGTI